MREPDAFVVRDERQWRAVWASLAPGAEPRPRIDFSRHMLVIALQGEQPSGGHYIGVAGIRDLGTGLQVRIREQSPGEGCPATQATTFPYQVVRVRRTNRPVTFVRHHRVVDCRPWCPTGLMQSLR